MGLFLLIRTSAAASIVVLLLCVSLTCAEVAVEKGQRHRQFLHPADAQKTSLHQGHAVEGHRGMPSRFSQYQERLEREHHQEGRHSARSHHQSLQPTLLENRAVAGIYEGLADQVFTITCPITHRCRANLRRDSNRNYISDCAKYREDTGVNVPAPPNTFPGSRDPRCTDIAECVDAEWGPGPFLEIVTDGCKEKFFEGYFGLDGLTFGILDWTSENLAVLFEMWQSTPELQAVFDSIFPPNIGIRAHMSGACVTADFVCTAGDTSWFLCDPAFVQAFTAALNHPLLQRVQVQFMYRQFVQRLRLFENLRLTTVYGITAMAAIYNNKKNAAECAPSYWVEQCKRDGITEEPALIDCMLIYYQHGPRNNRGEYTGCRNSLRGAMSRARAITKAWEHRSKSTPFVLPSPLPHYSSLSECSTRWGQSSGRRRHNATLGHTCYAHGEFGDCRRVVVNGKPVDPPVCPAPLQLEPQSCDGRGVQCCHPLTTNTKLVGYEPPPAEGVVGEDNEVANTPVDDSEVDGEDGQIVDGNAAKRDLPGDTSYFSQAIAFAKGEDDQTTTEQFSDSPDELGDGNDVLADRDSDDIVV